MVATQQTCCIFIIQYINDITVFWWLQCQVTSYSSYICVVKIIFTTYVKENAYITVVGLLLTKQHKSLMSKFNECPPHVKCNLYKSMDLYKSIIEFASPAWDPYTLLNVESIQSSAARFCLIIILGQAASLLCQFICN